jgi:hypothetical protein
MDMHESYLYGLFLGLAALLIWTVAETRAGEAGECISLPGIICTRPVVVPEPLPTPRRCAPTQSPPRGWADPASYDDCQRLRMRELGLRQVEGFGWTRRERWENSWIKYLLQKNRCPPLKRATSFAG